jgi:predicted transcriptional regulator
MDRFHRMVPAASRHGERQLRRADGRLEGVRVSDVMTADCVTLDGNMNVEQFVEDYLLRSGKRCFVVQQNGEVAGW